jgi:hypothetical protein
VAVHTLKGIVRSLHATTGELRETITKLEGELRKRARVDLDALADQAKEEITTKLLRLVSKLNG